MKTPITYWGGKQKMAAAIIRLMPAHSLYCEAFFGGGAVFFAKPPSRVEVINDTNGEVVNFYRIVQNNFCELQKEIRSSLHSRQLHSQARVIYDNPTMFSEVKRAWAFWMLANQSFGSSLIGGWSYDNQDGKMPHKLHNKQQNFTEEYAARLHNVQIECCNALHVINVRDSDGTFFYLDPPYFQANMGHYGGYTAANFEELLKALGGIKGKFLLSSYPSELLSDYVAQNRWQSVELPSSITVLTKKTSLHKIKTEVLTANYPIS